MSAIPFNISARDGAARAGRLELAHGVVNTPAFMPVGTHGSVKAMTPEELRAKFDECAARVLSPAAADGVVRAIHGLDGGADVGVLTALLRA